MAGIPLSYLAMETGWITREVGRQPWALYNMLRTSHSVSDIPASTVGASLFIFTIVYPLLFFLYFGFCRHIIRKGPGDDLKGDESTGSMGRRDRNDGEDGGAQGHGSERDGPQSADKGQ